MCPFKRKASLPAAKVVVWGCELVRADDGSDCRLTEEELVWRWSR